MNQSLFTRFAALCRPMIAVFTAYSALTGFLVAHSRSLHGTLPVAFGVFLLACGASALNQYQERKTDACMDRTRMRPLPAHTVAPLAALLFAIVLIAAGIALVAAAGLTPLLLGITAIIWYNGFYTGLKRASAFAAVPGAVVGMIPPALGWTAAGGSLLDARLFSLCFLFFLWQVPHFWLQMLHHGEEYEKAGLPALTRVLRKQQIARVSFIWICSAAAAGIMLPLYGAITSRVLSLLLIPGALWVAIKAFRLLSAQQSSALTLSAFRTVNGYILFIMSLLTAEGFLHLS